MSNSTMRALTIAETGDVFVINTTATIPRPVPSPTQVLVKVAFAGVNYYDIVERKGFMPAQLPLTLGHEASGTIVEVGSQVQHGFKVGDRVAFHGAGAYAEYAVVDTLALAKLPNDVSLEAGAASFVQGLTALGLVRNGYAVKKGDWVVIHAAAGGVGLLATQLAHHLGAHVIGTVSSDEKASIARANGAEHVVVITSGDYAPLEAAVEKLTGGKGVHAVYDSVGQATFESSLSIVRRLGTLVLYGLSSGPIPSLDVLRLSAKNVRLTWTNFSNYMKTREEFEELYSELIGYIEKGDVKVQVSKVYEFEDVKQAHLDLEGRKTAGKLLLKVN